MESKGVYIARTFYHDVKCRSQTILSRIVRKPPFCRSENKGQVSCGVAAQLVSMGAAEADQRLYFHYIFNIYSLLDSTVSLILIPSL